MYRAYFDITTVILYVVWGILGCWCINGFMTPTLVSNRGNAQRNKCCYFLFFFLYVFLAVFRKVADGGIGGADAIDYVFNFNNVFNGGLDRTGTVEFERGFQYFTKAIRYVTDNYKVYFLICYLLIVYGYARFIKEKVPRGLSYIPFLLLMYPYIRSFNTMRTSMAIAIILIGMTYIDKSKTKSFIIIFSSLLFHRMSIVFALIWFFYIFLYKYLSKIGRKEFALIVIGGVVISYVVALSLQNYLFVLSILDGGEESYLMASQGQNIFSRYPMFLGYALLYIAIICLYKKIDWDKNSVFLRTIFIFDAWVVPACLVLGMWRFLEYFYVIRLGLWSIILFTLIRKRRLMPAIVYKLGFFFIFVAWLVFRVFKEWEPAGLSPYLFDIL